MGCLTKAVILRNSDVVGSVYLLPTLLASAQLKGLRRRMKAVRKQRERPWAGLKSGESDCSQGVLVANWAGRPIKS